MEAWQIAPKPVNGSVVVGGQIKPCLCMIVPRSCVIRRSPVENLRKQRGRRAEQLVRSVGELMDVNWRCWFLGSQR